MSLLAVLRGRIASLWERPAAFTAVPAAPQLSSCGAYALRALLPPSLPRPAVGAITCSQERGRGPARARPAPGGQPQAPPTRTPTGAFQAGSGSPAGAQRRATFTSSWPRRNEDGAPRSEPRPEREWAPGFNPDTFELPRHLLEMRFARSSGAGGQNVNKVESKAEVRFHVESAAWLPAAVRQRLAVQQAARVNKAGELIFASEVHRSQQRNLEECFRRVEEAVVAAAREPKERKVSTKEPRAAKERRIADKKATAAKKQLRSRSFDD
eukprot:tig00000889_g5310.t1